MSDNNQLRKNEPLTREWGRRELLQTGGLLALGRGGVAAAETGIPNQKPSMKYRPLGRTGMTVSEIGLGAHYHYGGPGTKGRDYKSVEARREVVARALEAGINFYDNCIQPERETLGAVLPPHRERFYLMTDVNALRGKNKATAADLGQEFRENIKVLRTEYVDLFRFNNNNTPDEVTFELTELAYRVFQDFKKEGRARHFAVSGHDPDQMLKCINRYDFIEAFYMPFNYVTQGATKDLLPAAKRKGVGVIVIKPFMMGTMFALPEDDPALKGLREQRESLAVANLRFILSNDAVSTVIPGMRRAEEIDVNLKALQRRGVTQAELRALDRVAACVREHPRPGYEWLTQKWHVSA